MRIDEENNIIYFDNDEEFYDFCVSPEPVIKTSSKTGITYFDMDFTDWYKSHVDEDTKIVILDRHSDILYHGGVVTSHTCSKKINAYRVNPLDPDDPELLMEVGQ